MALCRLSGYHPAFEGAFSWLPLMSLPHFALLMLFCVTAGLNFVIAKIAVTEIPPVFLVAVRYAVLVMVLFPLLRWRGWPHFWRMVPAGLLTGGLVLAVAFTGTKLSSGSVAAVVVQLEMPMTVLLSIVWLKESVGWRRWLGVALTFGGVMMLGFDPAIIDYAVGVSLVALGAMFGAVGQILLRRLKDVEPLEMQAWTGAVSVPVLIIGTLIFEEGQVQSAIDAPWLLAGTVAYMVFAMSIIGHGIRFYIIQRNDIAVVSTVSAFAPTMGVVFSIVLLKEPATWQIVAGCLTVLSGVLIIAWRQAKKVEELPMQDALSAATDIAAGDTGNARIGLDAADEAQPLGPSKD